MKTEQAHFKSARCSRNRKQNKSNHSGLHSGVGKTEYPQSDGESVQPPKACHDVPTNYQGFQGCTAKVVPLEGFPDKAQIYPSYEPM